MSRNLHKLTATKAKSIHQEGRYNDGGGLYLRVRKNGYKSWVFSKKIAGKKKEVTLGDFEILSLADAREAARQTRIKAKQSAEVKAPKKAKPKCKSPTFLDVVELVLETKDSLWTNDKTRDQWHMTLKVYARPLHKIKVNKVTTPDVLAVLKPMWLNKNETASRLRGRIEAVMDYAKAMGWRTGENPAAWRGNLKLLLPAYSKTKNVKHHAALSFSDIPNFMIELRSREAIVSKMLEFIILTAARSGEARLATWDEIDFENRLWTISAKRMKMSKEHIVPLSMSALSVLEFVRKYKSENYIFAHPERKTPFSYNATRALLKRMNREEITTHGFRSTFRDWAGDRTLHQRETIEAALAHQIKDRAEAAYRRSTAIEKRRILMQDWDDFTSGQKYEPKSIIPHLEKQLNFH